MNLTEEEIRKITFDVISELGDKATPEKVKEFVNKRIESTEGGDIKLTLGDVSSGRVILTSFGLNHPGIVAGVTKALGDNNCDILDLSQKISFGLPNFYHIGNLFCVTYWCWHKSDNNTFYG